MGERTRCALFFGDNPPPDFITWKIPIPTHHTPVSHIKQRFGKGNDGDIFFFFFFSGKTEEGAKKKLREGNKTNGSWFTPARYTGNQKMHSDPSIVTIQKSMCPLFGTFFQKKEKIPFLLPPFLREKGNVWVERKFFLGGICKWPWKRGNERPRMERERNENAAQLSKTNPLTNSHFFTILFCSK